MPVSKKASGSAAIDALIKKGLVRYGADASLDIIRVPSGITSLDALLGGGLPLGRFMLVIGMESAGKTLMCQTIAASMQQQGMSVALVDAELAYDRDWWQSTGVNTDELLVSRPAGGEAVVDVVSALIDAVDLIIIDSGAALIPLKEQERSAEENSGIGSVARIHKKLFDHVIGKLSNSKTMVIMINQMRADIGNPRPGAFSLPGGRAQRFWSSVTLRVATVATRDDGRDVGITVIKNKVGVPGGKVVLPFRYDGTYDEISLVVADAIDRGIILHAGAWYRFPESFLTYAIADPIQSVAGSPDLVRVMGKESLRKVFAEDEGALNKLKDAVRSIPGADTDAEDTELEVE